jgi:hypothetical protein
MIVAAAALCACFLAASPINAPASTLQPEKVGIKADPDYTEYWPSTKSLTALLSWPEPAQCTSLACAVRQ